MKIDFARYNICLNDLKGFESNIATHDTFTADSVYFKINITESFDDMGLPINLDYIKYSASCDNDCVDYTILTNKLSSSGITFPFMFGTSPNMPQYTTTNHNESPDTRYYDIDSGDTYMVSGFVTGHTNDKLSLVRTYIASDQFVPGLDISTDTYINFLGDVIDGRTRLTQEGQPMTYVVDADMNQYIGTDAQTTGILYDTYSGLTYAIQNGNGIPVYRNRTDMRFIGEGWNQTNTSIDVYIRREFMMGVVFPPEIQNDLFIDRSRFSIIDHHERLSEIKTLDGLLDYGNGYYNINEQ